MGTSPVPFCCRCCCRRRPTAITTQPAAHERSDAHPNHGIGTRHSAHGRIAIEIRKRPTTTGLVFDGCCVIGAWTAVDGVTECGYATGAEIQRAHVFMGGGPC
jgi:hypothetical protein